MLDCKSLLDTISTHRSLAIRLQLLFSVTYGQYLSQLNKILIASYGVQVINLLLKPKYFGNLWVPKCEGELNLKRVEDLNKAAITKHIWSPFIQASSISVAWVRSDFIEREKVSGCEISTGQHWGWRTLLKLREEAEALLIFEMGDGSSICLCLDW